MPLPQSSSPAKAGDPVTRGGGYYWTPRLRGA